MAGFKDFREIAAWTLAHELKVRADLFLAKPDVVHRFKLCDQLSDAARSAPRNIAEGFARYRHKEFAQFVRIAKGSEAEVGTLGTRTHPKHLSSIRSESRNSS
jgi:four helix bundle protein